MQTFLISERSEMQRHCSANWLNVAPMVRRDPSRGEPLKLTCKIGLGCSDPLLPLRVHFRKSRS
jgi:hypothetical protein